MWVALSVVLVIIGIFAMVMNNKVGDGEDYEEGIEKKELQQRFVDIMSAYTVNRAEDLLAKSEEENNDEGYLEASEVLEYWKNREV